MSRQRGFTLIEVLVALAVIAIGFGAGFEALSGGVGTLRRVRDEQTALRMAESLLARLGHDIPLADGLLTGAGDGPGEPAYAWRIEIKPGGLATRPGQPAAHEVTVKVDWTEARFRRAIELASVRLAPG